MGQGGRAGMPLPVGALAALFTVLTAVGFLGTGVPVSLPTIILRKESSSEYSGLGGGLVN